MEKKFYLKKLEVLGLGKEPLVISSGEQERGIINLYKIGFPEEYYFIYHDFLEGLKRFLATGETGCLRELFLYKDILELQITLGEKGTEKVSVYNIILEKVENNYLNVISECLSVEGRTEIFRDQWEGIVCRNETLEEKLIQDLKISKNNCLWKSVIISSFMSASVYPEVEYIVKKFSIIDLNYYIGEITKRHQHETLAWINLHFSGKVQGKTKELLCRCFFEIDKIREDFRVEEKGITLDIRDQGSGFITCLVLFLHLYKMIIYGKREVVFLPDPLGSLHPILSKAILEYFDSALRETGGQLILFASK